MTCIVGYIDELGEKIIIGSDSAMTAGGTLRKAKKPKVFIKVDESEEHEFIFGVSGDFRIMDLLRYKFDIPIKSDNITTEKYIHTEFIDALIDCTKGNLYSTNDKGQENFDSHIMVGTDTGNLFVIEGNFQIIQVTDSYAAIGSGRDFALGSLHTTKHLYFTPEERVHKAIEAACEYSTTVEQPIIIESINY